MPMLSRIGGAGSIARHLSGSDNRVAIALALSSNQANYVLNTAKAGGGYVAGSTDITLTINAGVVIGSTSTSSYALDVDTSWAAGDTIKVISAGTVEGKGGAGGAPNSGAGGTGGPAMRCQRPVSIDNGSGVIASGGNGGTGGAMNTNAIAIMIPFGKVEACYGSAPANAAGGAGGKGAGAEAAGTYAAASGSGGSTVCGCAAGCQTGGTGATGGALGGGAYITGNANVTWLANGTRTGSVVA